MASQTHPAVELPKPNGDFYQVTKCLNEEERDTLKQVRDFMETKVAPVITKYWAQDSFPFELLPALRELKIEGLGY
jgi:alkylation response protein AidB-like acyl-CoA dehydrogenase